MSKYSQFEEEEILLDIISKADVSKYFVEIGCLENGRFSNTYLLKEKGWVGHWFDKDTYPGVIQETITKDNVNKVLRKYDVPYNLGVLSIDIDGNDYWILDALNFKPSIIIIEYNNKKDTGVFEYNEGYIWKGESNFGSSEAAITALANKKGYDLYGKTTSNLIFTCQNLSTN